MKLLLIYLVISMLFLVEVVFVVARPGSKTVETDSADVSDAGKLGRKTGQLVKEIFSEILGMVGTVTGLSYLSDYGKLGVKKATELGKKLMQIISTLEEHKFELIGSLIENSHGVLTNVTESGIGLAAEMAITGMNVFHSSVKSAQELTEKMKTRIDSVTSTADILTKSLHKITRLLGEISKLLEKKLDGTDE
uniref:Salivary secreted protein n=1 Tax=Rhodnius prolixus TaxID=13249 RepID=T1HBQ2_RHOPR